MRDQMWIQIVAPIEFLLAKRTPRQGYGGVKAGNSFSFEGAEMGVGGSVAGWCSDRSKPLEQGWQGNGFEVDLRARMREQTGKGECC